MRPVVHVEQIQSALVEDSRAAARIARDFSISAQVADAREFSRALVLALGQKPLAKPLETQWENDAVYRAAVRALGSNSRAWATFLRTEPLLAEVLGGYDPGVEPDLEDVRQHLPGQSGGNDARAVLKWRALLTKVPHYFERLVAAGDALSRMDVSEAELPVCLAVVIGNPPASSKAASGLKAVLDRIPSSEWKAPGMGPILASEFLRNLGFSGFKPDRHVIRLLDRWFPDVVESCGSRAGELSHAIGKRTADVRRFVTFALTGIAVTPVGYTYSEVDNLVWALGAYVERKGRETGRTYRL